MAHTELDLNFVRPDDYQAIMKQIKEGRQGKGKLLECPICQKRYWTGWGQAEKHWMSHAEAEREDALGLLIYGISPEQRITNVLNYLEREANGPSYPERMNNIRSAIDQLKEMWQKYQRGELRPKDSREPF